MGLPMVTLWRTCVDGHRVSRWRERLRLWAYFEMSLLQAGGHPFGRAEEAFKERGKVEVGVELGEVDAVAGGGDLDGLKFKILI